MKAGDKEKSWDGTSVAQVLDVLSLFGSQQKDGPPVTMSVLCNCVLSYNGL